MKQFDLVVIGAGPGGYVAAIRAAQLGLNVAVVEKHTVGGTCLNRGCIPTKSLIHSAEVFHTLKDASKFGLSCDNLSVDMTAVNKRRDEVVTKLRTGTEFLLKSNKVTLIRGFASFVDKNTLHIENDAPEDICAKNIIIAVGSEVKNPPMKGLELAVTSDDFLEGNLEIPQQVAVAGASVIGVEFATILNGLGKDVTIIATRDRLIPKSDRDLGVQLGNSLKKKGIKIIYGARMKEIEKKENGFKVSFTIGEGVESIETQMLIACIGRSAFLTGLKPENAGVQTHSAGITVNENLQTSTSNIYAIGDCVGGTQLAHFASAQGIAAVEHILGKKRSINLDVIPACIYTSPEIAEVGLSEEECLAKGIELEIGKFPMTANGKSVIVNNANGFIKTLFDKATGKLVGAAMFCERATDMIGELALAVANGLTREQFANTMHPHPTVCEAIYESVEDSHGIAIHTVKR